jgi:alpha-glucosidase
MTQPASKTQGDSWWHRAVIYQIYPRSFADSCGDGVGDLRGIAEHLDHVADLGVDAIWISPFFVSPMADFGYDVADYRDVDSLFGTLADFDNLVAEAHARGLRVIIDLVLSHSSERHPWFIESRSDRSNPRADWYVWADPKPDGTPPNNWLSIFGGPAWQWHAGRRQYYLHNFLASQPDLNFHNPQVRAEMLAIMRFWLDRGVDGFRLDVVNFYFHDAQLRDNPVRDPHRPMAGVSRTNPYAWQDPVRSQTQAENLAFLEEMRALADAYNAVLMGEIGPDSDADATMAAYTLPHRRLHMAYSFALLSAPFKPAALRAVVETMKAREGGGYPCWALANHDVVRTRTRFDLEADPDAGAFLTTALVTSLGAPACLYQGEELGLPEAEIPFEAMRDPYGIRFWPDQPGRDGCRTPMPWQADAAHAGFSPVQPWLPIPKAHLSRAVDIQGAACGSGLARIRRFLRWRAQEPLLQDTALRFLEAPEPVLAFIRAESGGGGESLLCLFHLGEITQRLTPPAIGLTRWGEPVPEAMSNARFQGDELVLDAFAVAFLRL